MKRYYLFMCLLAVLLVSCKEEPFDVTSVTAHVDAVYSSKADILIRVLDEKDGYDSHATVSTYGVYISDTNKQPDEKDIVVNEKNSDRYRTFLYLTVTGLAANTTYYIRPFVSNKLGTITGEVISITTNGNAIVTTNVATEITIKSAILNGSIQKNGNNVNLQKRGFVLSTSNNPTMEFNTKKWEDSNDKEGDFFVSATNLSSNTRYYFRAYVIVEGEVLYGVVKNFTTEMADETITLELHDPTNVTATSAKVSGTITIGKDAMGKVTEVGIKYVPTSEATFDRLVYKSGAEISSWTGAHTIEGTITFDDYYPSYWYYMYYIVDGKTYATDSKTATAADNGGVKNVAQIMSIYNSLNLAVGETSSDTYTVRAYVTQWKSGYPDYQNADFWIDDSANGSTTMLMCFRLTGVYESDRRTLVVGDYIEAQNCHLMNYNGKAELKDGTFTVIKAASANVPSLSDFLGTYSCHAHRQKNNDYVDWNNVVISERNIGVDNPDYNILVEGLIYGQSSYAAVGKFDESNGFIRLFGGWYLGENPCTINAKGDTLLYPIFYPIYVDNSNNAHYLDGYNYEEVFGQILLKRNSDGTLIFSPSDKADINNRYANAYRFDYVRASNGTVTGYNTVLYLLDGTTLTKTSSASAPSREHQRAIKAQH